MKIKTTVLSIALLLSISFSGISLAQETSNTKIKLKNKHEPVSNWSLNLLFSDNGFGLGGTLHKQLSKDVSGFASISFSGSKDDREFEQYDIYGNAFTPYKVNRLFMGVMNLGVQMRLFREDVSDNLRPLISFGIAPTAIMYTPSSQSFFKAFGYAQAKYTVGAFAGVGLDYVTNRHTSLSMNVRYYYISLFGQGVNSLSTEEKKNFGGIYFVFAFNFLH